MSSGLASTIIVVQRDFVDGLVKGYWIVASMKQM